MMTTAQQAVKIMTVAMSTTKTCYLRLVPTSQTTGDTTLPSAQKNISDPVQNINQTLMNTTNITNNLTGIWIRGLDTQDVIWQYDYMDYYN